MKEKFNIQGMSCSACSANIEKNVGKINGVNKVSVNLLQNIMVAEFDEKKVTSEGIIKAVENCGYGASIFGKKDFKSPDIYNESRTIKTRLLVSFGFIIPLMYISMGHMFSLPLPHFLHGTGNGVSFALTQMLLVLPIMYVNRKFFTSGFKALWHRAPNMDTLVALGSLAAFAYGVFAIYRMSYGLGISDFELISHYKNDLYFESAGMILALITVGKYLESLSKAKTNDAVKKLIKLTPKTASVIRLGKETVIPTSEVLKGDRVIVRQGGIIPVDGKIIKGDCTVDESAITGESIPSEKTLGSPVTGATVLKSGYIEFTAEKVGEDTVLSGIIRLVEEATAGKAPIALMADKVSGVFVPVVITLSCLSGVIWFLLGESFEFCLARAITVLVISCPCALGLATPTAIMVGMGKGAECSVLFKSSEALERLSGVDTVVFDKTGTLTEGKPSVTDFICASGITEEQILPIIASIEHLSEHPLSKSIVEYGNLKEYLPVLDYEAFPGEGVCGTVCNITYNCGNLKMVRRLGVDDSPFKEDMERLSKSGKTVIFVFDQNKIFCLIAIMDKIKDNTAYAIEYLKSMNIEALMITGDNKITAAAVKSAIGIDGFYAEVLPKDKEKHIRDLQKLGKCVCMVGDGINDAPALVSSDVGMAIGSGTDIAVESAGVILTKSDILDCVTAIKLSRRVIVNIKENLFWALVYNALCIPVAAGVFIPFGIMLNPMMGAAAMSLSSLFVVFNALRLRSFAPLEASHQKINKKEEVFMEKTIGIDGMMCQHCQMHVEKALGGIDGISEVLVSLENKEAVIKSKTEIADSVLVKAVTDAGYTVTCIK